MLTPKLYRIRQRFDSKSIEDVGAAVRDSFAAFGLAKKTRPGQTVAVGVGSRGLRDLTAVVKTTVECLRARRLEPFIFPAMGSHGGAIGAGQARVLAELGITELAVGAPIASNMDTVSLGRVESGAEVCFARDAAAADHIIVINRVKPHTAFRASVESGLCKMLAVGCGRHRGASQMHRFDLAKTIVPAARMILERTPVLGGLALTENATGHTHSIRLVGPEEFPEVDEELLGIAWTLLPKLPVDDLDVLIVDEMGKNVSGAGMDPNVIGYWRKEGGPREPDYRILIVLDLTTESLGNATGIGMADLTTRRLVDKVDWDATYMNALTSGVLRSARMPIVMDDDRAALEVALDCSVDPLGVRLARIVNTATLGTFWASEAVLPELRKEPDIYLDDAPLEIRFSRGGRMLSLSP